MAEHTISTYLDAPPDRVWDAVGTPRLLQYVTHPMIRFTPVAPPQFPDRWKEGDYVVRMALYGVLPLGRQVVSISWPAPEGEGLKIRDNGHSALIRRWDHLITIAPDGNGTCYTDRIEIEAGLITPIVAALARRFYAHRQKRWRNLVAAGFDYECA